MQRFSVSCRVRDEINEQKLSSLGSWLGEGPAISVAHGKSGQPHLSGFWKSLTGNMLTIFRPEARSRRSLSRSSSSPTNFEASDLHKTEFPSMILYAWTILPLLMPIWGNRKVLMLGKTNLNLKSRHLSTYWNGLENKTCKISVRRIRIGLDGSLLLYARTSGHGGSGHSNMVEDVRDGDIHQQCQCSDRTTYIYCYHLILCKCGCLSSSWNSFMLLLLRVMHHSTGNFYQNALG